MKGFITKYDINEGYGFIKAEYGKEIFFHKHDFSGDDVLELEFDVIHSEKGDRAVNIRKCSVKEKISRGLKDGI